MERQMKTKMENEIETAVVLGIHEMLSISG